MSANLSTDELVRWIRTVFRPGPEDRRLAFLVDLPDASLPDRPAWAERRALVDDWWRRISAARARLGLEEVALVRYAHVGSNNADLPEQARLARAANERENDGGRGDRAISFERIFREFRMLVAVTELSATAPLKLAAPRYGFRAATMPGFGAGMIPALRLDFEEVQRRCETLKQRLDRASGARLLFEAAGREHPLFLDLRWRAATASGGLVRRPGTAGNVPSGETYIVPYEGERPGEPSRSRGRLPLELDGELLLYRIERNRVVELVGSGSVADEERCKLAEEPAYGNLAELGLGLLAEFGLRPTGTVLLDEKLGPHLAFGRSDHFGGSVGAAQFHDPRRVVHVDRVYLPELQPGVRLRELVLEADEPGGAVRTPLLRDGRYL